MLAWHNITSNNIFIGSDGKIDSHKFSYLCLTTIIQPLNAIWMQVWLGGKCKLLHHVAASQVVAATSVDDHMARTLFDDTLCVETMCAADFAPPSPFARSAHAAQ